MVQGGKDKCIDLKVYITDENSNYISSRNVVRHTSALSPTLLSHSFLPSSAAPSSHALVREWTARAAAAHHVPQSRQQGGYQQQPWN